MQGVHDSANQQPKARLPAAGSRGASARGLFLQEGLCGGQKKRDLTHQIAILGLLFCCDIFRERPLPRSDPSIGQSHAPSSPSRPLVAPPVLLGLWSDPCPFPDSCPPYPPLPSQMRPGSHSLRSQTLCKLPGRPLRNSFVGNTTGCPAIHSFLSYATVNSSHSLNCRELGPRTIRTINKSTHQHRAIVPRQLTIDSTRYNPRPPASSHPFPFGRLDTRAWNGAQPIKPDS